jgi:site-specific recombinase XerD
MSKIVTEAIRYLGTVRNYAAATLDSYQASCDQFHDFLTARGLPDELRQFTGDNVRRFAESLAAKGQKASTVVIRLSGLSTIATTLMTLQDGRGRPYLQQNPTRTFKWPTVDSPETKFLLPNEMAAFLAVARPLRESVARDILVDTGLRCSELCRASVGDVISVEGRTALAVTVKGRGQRQRKRHVPVSAPVASALFEHLMERGIANPQDAAHRDAPLLLTHDQRRWGRSGLSSLMARIGREAGISRFRISAHKLRHTANVVARFARRSDGAALDRWTRSQLLSHTSPSSLDRYEHLVPGELFEARDAQREALGRYVGGGTDGKAVPVNGSAARPGTPTLEGLEHAFAELEGLVRRSRILLRRDVSEGPGDHTD